MEYGERVHYGISGDGVDWLQGEMGPEGLQCRAEGEVVHGMWRLWGALRGKKGNVKEQERLGLVTITATVRPDLDRVRWCLEETLGHRVRMYGSIVEDDDMNPEGWCLKALMRHESVGSEEQVQSRLTEILTSPRGVSDFVGCLYEEDKQDEGSSSLLSSWSRQQVRLIEERRVAIVFGGNVFPWIVVDET